MIEDTRPLEDVQGRPDERGIDINQAGVRDLRYPITVLTVPGANSRPWRA